MNHLIPQLGRESMMHLQNGNLLEAEKLLLKLLEINPHEINALKLYGFVQWPLYQNLNGYQLAPKYTASVGLQLAF